MASLPEKLQSSPSTPSKNIQLQKPPNSKPSNLSFGDESPRSFAGKKSKNELSFRDQQQVDQIPEEEVKFYLSRQIEEQQQQVKAASPKRSEEKILHIKNMSDSMEGFEKYDYNTISPLTGVRTTKVSIEPIRTGITPKTTTNAKLNDDLVDSSVALPLRIAFIRSKSKVLHSSSKILNSQESKLSARITKKNDSHSHNNQEKDNFKQENHSNTSFEVEPEVKEKQAFLTEARDNPFGIERKDTEKQEEEGEYTNDDTLSQKSDGKNREKDLSSKRRIAQKEKNKYDPYAVLNKVRSEKFRNKASLDRRFLGHARSEVRVPQRGDFSTKMRSSEPRDFTVLRSKKMNLFEGIPYVPYDVFLRQDISMQNVMIKDLLKILFDKAKSLKNLFQDTYRMERIMKNIEEAEQSALNLHTEETVGLVNAVGSLIMQEFRDSIDKIGIKPSPIFDNPQLKLFGFENEVERFYDNCTLYLESLDHLRDCIDCYYVMSRQKDRKPMIDADCSDLLQFIARARYNLGQLYEAFRVIEKHVDAKLAWEIEKDPIKQKERQRKLENKANTVNPNKLKSDTYKLLNELLHNKFNINKNKLAATRESKVILNQEAEDEKFLTILQNQKQLKKKGAKNLGDNRKLLILNRLLNPIEDPQIHAAMKVAQEKTNVQLSRDLVEYMASKGKGSTMKAKLDKDLPLKDNLQKIFSNKKLTKLCFDWKDGQVPTDIVNKLSIKNKNFEIKEVVDNVVHHSKSKKHLGCLFEGEVLKHGSGQLVEQKTVKLPTLQKTPKRNCKREP